MNAAIVVGALTAFWLLVGDGTSEQRSTTRAVARVNRPHEGKTYGLVVDYWGVADDLQDALGIFETQDIQGALTPLEDQLPRVQVLHRRAMHYFDRVDRGDLDACVSVLEPEDRRAEFDAVFLELARAMDMLLPDARAVPYIKDLQWLGKVRMAARARFREEHFDLKHCGEKVRALISEYIGADEVKRLLEPVSIFSQRFDEEVRRLTRPEAKASEMEHALRYEIKVRYEDNPVVYESLRERLEKIIADRKAARISQAEQLRQLAALVDELRGMQSRIEELGLTQASFPIYELLLKHRDVHTAEPRRVAEARATYHAEIDESAKDLAAEIESDIKELAVIDWTRKEDVQREMRRRIKRRLRNAGFPPETVEAATTQILDVARRTIA